MNDFVVFLADYIAKAGMATAMHVLVTLGPLLVLAFLMSFLSRWNETLSYKVFGRRTYLVLFGWLGVSVHELSHAFFALLFGHKINKVVLFKPDPESGTLGHVDHSYNPRNAYHQVGNFFIGIGPVLMGAFLLYLLSKLLFDADFGGFLFLSGQEVSLHTLKALAFGVWDGTSIFMQAVFSTDLVSLWKVILFLYCLYSVGSAITLSSSDVLTAWKGFVVIVLLFFLFNLATLWKGNLAVNCLLKASEVLFGFYAITLLTILLNLAFSIILSAIVLLKRICCQR